MSQQAQDIASLSLVGSIRVGGLTGRRFNRRPVEVSMDAIFREVRGRRRRQRAEDRVDGWCEELAALDRVPLADLASLLAWTDERSHDSESVAFIDLELNASGSIRQIGVVVEVESRIYKAEGLSPDLAYLEAIGLTRVLVAHNGVAHDFPVLRRHGCEISLDRVSDSLRWSWLAWPTDPAHALGAIYSRHVDADTPEFHDAVADALALHAVWTAIREALRSLPSGESGAIRGALGGIERVSVLDDLLPGPATQWVPPVEAWSELASAVGSERRKVVTAGLMDVFPPDDSVLVVADLRRFFVARPGVSVVARPARVIDLAAADAGCSGWARAVAVAASHRCNGLLDLLPVQAASLLTAFVRGGEAPLVMGTGPLISDTLTVTACELERELVWGGGLASLFEPVATGVQLAWSEADEPVHLSELSQDEMDELRSGESLLDVDRSLLAAFDRREGWLAGDASEATWFLDAVDPLSCSQGFTLVTDGPVGRGRASLDLWQLLFGQDVQVEGAASIECRAATLSGVQERSARHAGRQLIDLLALAAQPLKEGESSLLVTSFAERRAVLDAGAPASWKKLTSTFLLRPPLWPTADETTRRLDNGAVAVAGTRDVKALAPHVRHIFVAGDLIPSPTHPTMRRMLDAATEPFAEVVEPLSAHLRAELACTAAPQLTTFVNNRIGAGLLSDLIGPSPETRRADLQEDRAVTDELSSLLTGEAATRDDDERSVRIATRRILRGAPLREYQRGVISDVLSQRDVVGVFRTGRGKSACYQIPGLVLAADNVMTVVVSPLIALQRDQMNSMRKQGIYETVAYNSELAPEIRAAIRRGIEAGFYRVVLLSPEALFGSAIVKSLREASVGLLVVDEAHCISEMGHDFRPDYRSLPIAIRRLLAVPDTAPFPAPGHRPTFLALTGTATPDVVDDIVERLSSTFVQHADTTLVRDELRFSVSVISEPEDRFGDGPRSARQPERWHALVELLETREGPAIVYVATRRDADDLARELETVLGETCLAYHAGLSSDVRRDRESAFLDGPADLIVATSAFGMGIDKADVKLVVHWQVPPTPEALYQEAGRAGRGALGQPARAVLLFHEPDLDRSLEIVRQGVPSAEEVERVDAAIGEIADLQGSRVAVVSDGDLRRLAGLRPSVDPFVVVAHLSQAGLIAERERLFGAQSYLRGENSDLGRLTSLERMLLECVDEGDRPTGIRATDIAEDAGVGVSALFQTMRGLENKGHLRQVRSIAARRASSTPAVEIQRTRELALSTWAHLDRHHARNGPRRWFRGLASVLGDIGSAARALETLAAMGTIDVRYERLDGGLPAIRRTGDHAAALPRLRDGFADAAAVVERLPASTAEGTVIEVSTLSEELGLTEPRVLDALTVAHLCGVAVVDLRSWESDRVEVTRMLEVVEVADRELQLDHARLAAQGRARLQLLRLDALARYATIEPSQDADAHQAYLERYLRERDFLEEIARSKTKDLLSGLSQAQRNVVTCVEDHVVVIAGPGTGKTRTLTHRIAYQARAAKVPPERMLAVTFTRAATEEMRARLAQLGVRGVRVRTLHSIAFRVLNENWRLLQLDACPELVDERIETAMVSEAMAIASIDGKAVKSQRDAIRLEKAKCEPPSPLRQIYDELLAGSGLMDFGSALLWAADLLRLEELNAFGHGIEELYVDECQDLSPAQINLVEALGGSRRKVFVGDPRQAIYGWNGATAEALLAAAAHPSTASLELVENFRSGGEILRGANEIIRHVLPQLSPVVPVDGAPGGTVTSGALNTEEEMLQRLAGVVRAWLDAGVPTDEVAVVAYKGRMVGQTASALRSAGIPARAEGLVKLSATDVFAAAMDEASGLSTDEGTVDDLLDMLEVSDSVGVVLQSVDELGGSDARDDWERLRAELLERLAGEASELVEALSAIQRDREPQPDGSGVTVTTMHKAKGLEWRAVAVLDASSSGIQPTAEGCRVLYVAVTRAKEYLDVSWAGSPSKYLPESWVGKGSSSSA